MGKRKERERARILARLHREPGWLDPPPRNAPRVPPGRGGRRAILRFIGFYLGIAVALALAAAALVLIVEAVG